MMLNYYCRSGMEKTWRNNTPYGIDVFHVMCDTTRVMGDLTLELKYWA